MAGLLRVHGVTDAWGWSVEIMSAAEVVADLLSSAGAEPRDSPENLRPGIVKQVRMVFGSDAQSTDALEEACRDGSRAAVEQLTSALGWYARRDQAFAEKLVGWAALSGPTHH